MKIYTLSGARCRCGGDILIYRRWFPRCWWASWPWHWVASCSICLDTNPNLYRTRRGAEQAQSGHWGPPLGPAQYWHAKRPWRIVHRGGRILPGVWSRWKPHRSDEIEEAAAWLARSEPGTIVTLF